MVPNVTGIMHAQQQYPSTSHMHAVRILHTAFKNALYAYKNACLSDRAVARDGRDSS